MRDAKTILAVFPKFATDGPMQSKQSTPLIISYRPSEEARTGYEKFLQRIIETRGIRTVCDIGGGANPALPIEYIRQHNLEYTVLDISESELEKAPSEYRKITADIASPLFSSGGQKFDLVFSKMLAEHINGAAQFHANIAGMLEPAGVAVHFFPTLFAPPFVINWLIPEWLSDRLLGIFAPRNRYQHAKFPAYYQWCRGPTRGQFQRFKSVGLDVLEYIGFFGHAGYYRRIPGVLQVHRLITRFLLVNPNPYLTSFAYLVVTRTEGESDSGQ